jgi:hypothetical protein
MVNESKDTICHAVVNFRKRPGRTDQKKIKQWLQVRTKADSLVVVIP